MSRTRHKQRMSEQDELEILSRETAGLDIRFWCGKHDLSELPSAYKNAQRVEEEMAQFKLARIVDRILPYGSIMAGDWEGDAPWRKKKT
jgi:RNA-splicing ligase RtcB